MADRIGIKCRWMDESPKGVTGDALLSAIACLLRPDVFSANCEVPGVIAAAARILSRPEARDVREQKLRRIQELEAEIAALKAETCDAA